MVDNLRNDMPSVSVVIPAYRAAAFLREAVESVRGQTVQPVEVIIVDDHSPDDTVSVARALGETVVESPVNTGAAGARNRGIALARGEWVAFLDADDRWHPRHLETSLGALCESGAILCSSRTSTAPSFPSLDLPLDYQQFGGVELMAHLLGPNPVAQTTCVVRRDVLERVGGYRDGERYCEDYELWLRLAPEGSFVTLNAVTCLYRLHGGQTSRSSLQMFAKAWEHRLAAYRRWSEQLGASVAGREVLFNASLARAMAVDIRAVWYDADSSARDFFANLAQDAPETRDCWRREIAARDPWLVAKLRCTVRRIVRNPA